MSGDGVKTDSSGVSAGEVVGGGDLASSITFASDSHLVYLSELLVEAKKNLQVTGDNTKKNGVTYALFGSSGSGKSTIIRKVFADDLYKNPDGTPDEDQYVSTLFTESKHADPLQGIDADDLIIDACGVNEELYKWMYGMNYMHEKKFNFCVMIDDVITVKSLPTIFKAFLTYRNMNITSVVSLQYLKLCPLSVRSSLYFCFLLPSNSNEGIEQLVRGYLGMYLKGHSLSEKINAYKSMAKDYHFFLMDNLNHKCYYVDNNYYAREITPRPLEERIDFPSEEQKHIMNEVSKMDDPSDPEEQPSKKRKMSVV